ncbi:hypothetical protein [Alkaliphilus peptidifermentans]|uniref:Uncharacterized protein n=1 Tax=Alkaliphilus peptidifermentans DSM 18978 TaxID=1120976 RepID=A0A1G5AJ34_9FIRM|nr:hypothetical protein [Alkaliphilus peptidifermentans]SCX77911.1 hypothetical protein SAMN03080606_00160 [Alkaliphilus peptidifermentans DSM 18978]
MEDKVLDLLEKMYIEMQEMKQVMATKDDIKNMATKDDIKNMATKDDIKRLENNMVKMENELKDDIRGLYDRYKQCVEGISGINYKLDKLTEKVDNQEIRLQVLKTAK